MFDHDQLAEAEGQLDEALGKYNNPGPDGLGDAVDVYANDDDGLVGVGGVPSMSGYLAPAPAAPPQMMQRPMDGYQAKWLEPSDTSSASAMRSAGITALVVAAAGGLGLAFGGGWGALAGVLGSGAAFNTYRAQKDFASPDASKKHEAMVSTVFAVAGLAAGGYAAYKAYNSTDKVY